MLTYNDLVRLRPQRSRTSYGWRVCKSIYCQESNGVFLLSRKDSRYKNKEDWKFEVLAYCSSSSGWQALTDDAFCDADMKKLIGFSVRKIPGRAVHGLIFSWYDVGKQRTIEIQGRYPIKIYSDYIAASPVAVRTVDETKRRAFNAKLKEVRNFFRVRAKLGVFNNFVIDECKDTWFKNRKSFVETLLAVDVNDINTFKPILGRMTRWTWRAPKVFADLGRDLLEMFNQVIDSEREQCKIELDVVTYVVP